MCHQYAEIHRLPSIFSIISGFASRIFERRFTKPYRGTDYVHMPKWMDKSEFKMLQTIWIKFIFEPHMGRSINGMQVVWRSTG